MARSGPMATSTVTQRWERYAWAAGWLFVLALLAESIVSTAVDVNQDDSAATIAAALLEHRTRLIVIACLSIIYALSFVIYLWRLCPRSWAGRWWPSQCCSSSRVSAWAA